MTFENVLSIAQTLISIAWFALAYIIFKLQAETFRIQANIFKDQQRITEMASVKFLYDIKPVFVKNIKIQDYYYDSDGSRFYEYSVILGNRNLTKNLEIMNNSTAFTKGFRPREIIPLVAFEREIEIFSAQYFSKEFTTEINVNLFFEDEVGTKYKQTLHGVLTDLQLDPPFKC